MLDLMCACWSQEPGERPSAADVRLIASCPQFCHLIDAVSLSAAVPILTACSVFVDPGEWTAPDTPGTSRSIVY
jgi:hypothetical protein